MISVSVKDGNIDLAVKSGLSSELKKKQHYDKPGVVRRNAKKEARKNARKNNRKEQY